MSEPRRLADKRVYPSQAIDDRYGGLTLREHYAGLALQGLIAAGRWNSDVPPERLDRAFAQQSIAIADALCAELERARG